MTSSEPRVARMRARIKGTDQVAVVHGAELVSGFVRTMPSKGTRDLLKAYGASPMLQALVRKIAATTASIKWKAFAELATGDKVEVPNHIAARMLNAGVPGLDGYQCQMLEQQSIELVGEAFSLLERNFLGVPFRRWPLPSDWIRNVPQPTEDLFEVQATGSAKAALVRRDNMLWVKDVDPANPYRRGMGVARSLADELNADEAAAKHTGASLNNRARPDIIISGSKEMPLNREQMERLHETWQQRFGGPMNAGKPFTSAGPISVSTLTPSFRELQLKDLREFERDFMITVLGIPPEIMGVLENANRSTIDTAEFLFMKHVIKPRLDARASAYNDQLAPQYDPHLSLGFDDPVQENKEFKLEVMRGRPRAFSHDEVRELAGEAPLPDGEGEWQPAPEFGALGQAPAAAGDGSSSLADGQEPAGEAASHVSPVTRGLLAPEHKIREVDIEEILAAMDDGLMAEIMTAGNRDAVAEFGDETLESLRSEISFDISSPRVEDFLNEAAGERSSLINGTTRKQLRAQLTEGIRGGENTRKLVNRIQSVITDAGDARAETIARTETVRARGFAVEEAHQQAGVTEKEWLAVQGDNRTRDSHEKMDGQRVPSGQPFVSPDGFTAQYPGDFGVASEDINCRCSVIAVDEAPDKAKRVEIWKASEANRERQERVFKQGVRSAFRQQGDQIIEALERRG